MQNHQIELSNVTEKYLSGFYDILDEMIDEMTSVQLTDSISHNFIVQMIPHHRAAIEMSRSILQYTTCIPLQNIAANIIAEQTKSIEDMRDAENCCAGLQNTEEDLQLYMQCYHQITHVMFTNMNNALITNDVNADFLHEMIPHHKGAIRMSQNAMRFPICPELRPILQAIITSQKAGVRKMEHLLRCN